MEINFIKMHGTGNDFIVIDNMDNKVNLSKEQISFLCDRHFGIGADGVILVEFKDGVDCFMNYYNSDGTEAEMCGNGIRCTALFVQDYLNIKKENYTIYTRGGIKEVTRGKDGTFSVNMGKASFESSDFPTQSIYLEGLKLDFVSMGNPHAITFVENVDEFDLWTIGPKIEKNENFRNKINFEIVEKINDKEYKVRVWERGCGETLSCGTGACAVYSVLNKITNLDETTVYLPGGMLFINKLQDGSVLMRGEAKSVYSGIIKL